MDVYINICIYVLYSRFQSLFIFRGQQDHAHPSMAVPQETSLLQCLMWSQSWGFPVDIFMGRVLPRPSDCSSVAWLLFTSSCTPGPGPHSFTCLTNTERKNSLVPYPSGWCPLTPNAFNSGDSSASGVSTFPALHDKTLRWCFSLQSYTVIASFSLQASWRMKLCVFQWDLYDIWAFHQLFGSDFK